MKMDRPWVHGLELVIALTVIVAVALNSLLSAGEYNPTLNVGDAAPAWAELPGTDGKNHSLADMADKQVIVVVFTCNSCPVAVDYEDRLIAEAQKRADAGESVAFVAINVNTVSEDRLPKMIERAKAKNLPYPYLYDESQAIAKAYGATYTPECFVLNRERKVVYMGGIDDNSNPQEVKATYLGPAITAALAGEKLAVGETIARGCTIRYVSERRRKAKAAK